GLRDDSRCPADVQCIRAGAATVRLALTARDGTQRFVEAASDALPAAWTVDCERLVLRALGPAPRSGIELALGRE
ncbi:MAG TPA: hypothetical protein VIG68_03000, partial [Lysobacter sp.]